MQWNVWELYAVVRVIMMCSPSCSSIFKFTSHIARRGSPFTPGAPAAPPPELAPTDRSLPIPETGPGNFDVVLLDVKVGLGSADVAPTPADLLPMIGGLTAGFAVAGKRVAPTPTLLGTCALITAVGLGLVCD